MSSSPRNFALTGAAGYVAPRHLQAIHDTGNILVAALDRSDSVGILDRFFPEANFFTEFERFDRHIEKLRRAGEGSRIDYVSICSPNYLHDAHIRFALRVGADAICEKPLVLNPWNIDALSEMEQETGRRVWTILQLRLHPALVELKKRIEQAPAGQKHDIDLTYITSRGRWYGVSWKGDVQKSGGCRNEHRRPLLRHAALDLRGLDPAGGPFVHSGKSRRLLGTGQSPGALVPVA